MIKFSQLHTIKAYLYLKCTINFLFSGADCWICHEIVCTCQSFATLTSHADALRACCPFVQHQRYPNVLFKMSSARCLLHKTCQLFLKIKWLLNMKRTLFQKESNFTCLTANWLESGRSISSMVFLYFLHTGLFFSSCTTL